MAQKREVSGSTAQPDQDQPPTESRRRFLAAVAAVAGTVGIAGCTTRAPETTAAAAPDCGVKGIGQEDARVSQPPSSRPGYLVRGKDEILYFIPASQWDPASGMAAPLRPEFELPWIMQPRSNTNISRLMESNFRCENGRPITDLPPDEPLPGRPRTMFEIFGK